MLGVQRRSLVRVMRVAGCAALLSACSSRPPAPGEADAGPGAPPTSEAGKTAAASGGTTAAASGAGATMAAGVTATGGSSGSTANTMMGSVPMAGGAAPNTETAGTSSTTPQAGMTGAAAGSGAAGGSSEAETCSTVIPPSMDCKAKLAPGDERTCMLGSRKYIVHAGKTMNPCKPVALVLDAHGATETAGNSSAARSSVRAACAGRASARVGLPNPIRQEAASSPSSRRATTTCGPRATRTSCCSSSRR